MPLFNIISLRSLFAPFLVRGFVVYVQVGYDRGGKIHFGQLVVFLTDERENCPLSLECNKLQHFLQYCSSSTWAITVVRG